MGSLVKKAALFLTKELHRFTEKAFKKMVEFSEALLIFFFLGKKKKGRWEKEKATLFPSFF